MSARPAGSSPPPPAPPTPRPPLWVVFGITVTGILNNTLIAPAIPEILDDLGVGDGSAGLLVAAGTLPGIVVAPAVGVAADRWGRRAVLVPALVVFGVFGAAQALSPSFAVLLALRFLQGVGAAALLNLSVTIISDHWAGQARATALGRNAAVLTVSLAVLPPIGGLLTEVGSWRLAVAPYLLALATAVVMWSRLPGGRPVRPDGGGQVRVALAAMRQPVVVGATVAGFVVFLLIFGLFLTVLPLHLEDRFGLDPGGIGLVLALPAVSATAAALALGRLRGRYDTRPLLTVAWVCIAVAFAGIAEAPVLGALLAAGLLYGLGEGLLIPTLQDQVAGAAPDDHRGAVIAVFGGAVRAGQTVGPLAAGAALAVGSTSTPLLVGAAIAGAALVGQAVYTRPRAGAGVTVPQ